MSECNKALFDAFEEVMTKRVVPMWNVFCPDHFIIHLEKGSRLRPKGFVYVDGGPFLEAAMDLGEVHAVAVLDGNNNLSSAGVFRFMPSFFLSFSLSPDTPIPTTIKLGRGPLGSETEFVDIESLVRVQVQRLFSPLKLLVSPWLVEKTMITPLDSPGEFTVKGLICPPTKNRASARITFSRIEEAPWVIATALEVVVDGTVILEFPVL